MNIKYGNVINTLNKGDNLDIDMWKEHFEKRNKEFKRDVNLFIFMMAWCSKHYKKILLLYVEESGHQ